MNYNILLKAVDFAAHKHKNQRRKDIGATPYINHPIRVSMTLSDCGEDDIDLLVAAILHDTIEDTKTTEKELTDLFGENVCSIVLEVTDDKSLPKEERKRLQIINAPKKSMKAKKLKYADLICNLTDILEHPPQGWSIERKIQYFDWSKRIGKGLGDVNLGLNERLNKLFEMAEDGFKE